jgi:hypothetical protein
MFTNPVVGIVQKSTRELKGKRAILQGWKLYQSRFHTDEAPARRKGLCYSREGLTTSMFLHCNVQVVFGEGGENKRTVMGLEEGGGQVVVATLFFFSPSPLAINDLTASVVPPKTLRRLAPFSGSRKLEDMEDRTAGQDPLLAVLRTKAKVGELPGNWIATGGRLCTSGPSLNLA